MTLHEQHAATLADLTAWRDRLVVWRKNLCDQLVACPPRSPLQQGLTLSIIHLDRHVPVAMPHLPLHDLMAADGYGPDEWLGSLNTIEKLLTEYRL